MKIETVKLNNGVEVLAKSTKQFGTNAVTYANRTQAEKKAAQLNELGGLKAEVVQPGRVFFVKVTFIEEAPVAEAPVSYAVKYGKGKNQIAQAGSLKEASEIVRAYIESKGLGNSQWSNQETGKVFANGEEVARISYNGRIWDLAGVEIKEAPVADQPAAEAPEALVFGKKYTVTIHNRGKEAIIFKNLVFAGVVDGFNMFQYKDSTGLDKGWPVHLDRVSYQIEEDDQPVAAEEPVAHGYVNPDADQPEAVVAGQDQPADKYNPLADRGIADDVATRLVALYRRHSIALANGDQGNLGLDEFNALCKKIGQNETSVFSTLSVEEDWLRDMLEEGFCNVLADQYRELTGKAFIADEAPAVDYKKARFCTSGLRHKREAREEKSAEERIREAAKEGGFEKFESFPDETETGRKYKITFFSSDPAYTFAKALVDLKPYITKSGRVHIVEIYVEDAEAVPLNERMLRDSIGLAQAAWYQRYDSGDYLQYREIAIKHGFGLQTNSFPVLRATHPDCIIKAVVDFTYPKAAGFDRSEWMKSKAVKLDSPTMFINFIDVLHQIEVDFIMIEVEDAKGNTDITARVIGKLIGQDFPGGDDQPDPNGGVEITDQGSRRPLTDEEQVAKYGPEAEKLHDSVYMEPEEFVAKHDPDQPQADDHSEPVTWAEMQGVTELPNGVLISVDIDQPEFSIELAKDYDIEPNRYKVKKHFFGVYREPKHLAADIESFFEKYGPAVLQMIMIKEVINNNIDFISLTYFKRHYLSNAKQDDQPRPSFPAGGIIAKEGEFINEEPTLPEPGVPVDEFPELAEMYPGGRILQYAIGKDKGTHIKSRRQLLGFISHCKSKQINHIKLKIRLADGGSRFCNATIEDFNPGQWEPAVSSIDQGYIKKLAAATGMPEEYFSNPSFIKDLPCGFQRAYDFLTTTGELPNLEQAKALASLPEAAWREAVQVIGRDRHGYASIPNLMDLIKKLPAAKKPIRPNHPKGGNKSKYHD